MKPHVWFVALLALGCAHTSETWPDWFEDGATCLTVPWDDLPQAAGEIQTLTCGTTVDCPPPLICRGSDGGKNCEIERDVRDPTSIAELYERPVFRVTATAGDDYNFLAFDGLPAEALYVHCGFYNCPIDQDVIRYNAKRCRITTEIIELGTSDTLALTTITDGPTKLELTSAENACYAPDDTDSARHLPIQIGTIGFFGYCLAYGETDIEAVSDIFQLDRTEIGEIGRRFYSERCEGAESVGGDPCIRYLLEDDGSLVEDTHPGVCVPTTPTDDRDPSALCCPVCFGANECRSQGLGGEADDPRCYSMGGFSRPDGEDAEPAPPFVGYCATTRCSSDRGDIWILEADGTMTAVDDDDDQQEDPPEEPADGGMPPGDGGMGMDLDAGLPPDGMPPAADMGPPAADMGEPEDAARMPRPDMMEPPR